MTAFAQWMRAWADRKGDWNQNLFVLGDFNLDRLGNPLYNAFVSTGLWPPTVLNEVPRTVFDNDKDRHNYDQIAWFDNISRTGGDVTTYSLLDGLWFAGHGGHIDFLPYVFPELNKTQVSWRVSDHYPLWVELRLGSRPPMKSRGGLVGSLSPSEWAVVRELLTGQSHR